MSTDFNVSPTALVYSLIGIMTFLIGFILIGKQYYKWLSKKRLRGENVTNNFSSPMIGRNKYPEVDVFKASGSYLKVGLFVALAITVLAMNTTTYEEVIDIPEDALVISEEFEIEPPRTAEPPPPPPPPPPPVIEEVPNEEFIEEDEVEFLDQSIDEKTEVAYVEAPTAEKKDATPPPPPPPPPPPQEVEAAEIFKIVEEMPHFPGCEGIADKQELRTCADKKMLEYIYGNIKYPAMARENGIDGTVVIQFIVSNKGEIQKAKILRDIGAGCGEEALRVVNLMNEKVGPWTPGKQRGKKVHVQFMLPIKFKLQYANSK